MWKYTKRLECDLAKRDKILFIERELSQQCVLTLAHLLL